MNSASATALEKKGRKRFRSGIEFEKELLSLTRAIQDRLINNLPSNYPKDRNTNLAEFFRAVSKEFARLQISASDINEDKYHANTRTEYLFQILGDSLFLGEKAINENLNDSEYREFLIRVRNAYFGGSRSANIESAVSEILGLPVTLRELYLEARKENSFYGLKDTHTMFFDILMDNSESSNIGVLLDDLSFFIDLIKPAHVIYDTRLIWTEDFLNKDANCTPVYDMVPNDYTAYSTTLMHQVTYLLSSLYKFDGTDPDQTWVEGVIGSIDTDNKVILTVNKKKLVYNESTVFYREESGDYVIISPESLSAGDDIRYYATKDDEDNSELITDEWLYSGVIDTIDEVKETVLLQDGSYIVYNIDTLVYTRDGFGEYRINIDDLLVGYEVVFKATKYDEAFDFYQVPQEVQDNEFKQFDSEVIKKPFFQENVKKELDTPDGLVEGPNVIIEDGVAKVIEVDTQFYKKENTKSYRERITYRYSLYIDDVFQKQFSVNDPEQPLTTEEAKQIFIDVHGYTQLNDPRTAYYIETAETGEMIEDGDQSTLQAVEEQTELCERKAMCQLSPYYEDIRKYWTWPDIQLTSGFFTVSHPFDVDSPAGALDVPAWFYLSSDPNTYQMPQLPMLGSDSDPAEVSDVVVYVNGLLVEDAVSSMDPWTGIVSLNFIPPFDTEVRIDYYYADRYPKPQLYLEEVLSEAEGEIEGDIPGQMNIITSGGTVKRLTWPFEPSDPELYGDDRDYQVDKFPILNQMGELATKDEVDVFVGSVIAKGTTEVYSQTSSSTTFTNLDSDWTDVQDGDILILEAGNYLDNTINYTISSVDTLNDRITVPNVLPPLQDTYRYRIVRFIEVEDSVEDIRPILGHVRLNFIPPIKTIVRFNYHYTHHLRNYLLLPDQEVQGDTFWDYPGSEYSSDTFFGPRAGYTLMVDQAADQVDKPYWSFEELLKIGHRYRMYNLTSSSVLNSIETFPLNEFDFNKNNASFKNRGGVLNDFNLMFSPEFLDDTDKNVILNDTYLKKDLPANTVLNPGVPTFAETFTDDGHYKNFVVANETDTYDPILEGGKDLVGSFSIIDPDKAGIIDYNGVCDYMDNKKINLYSDLKKVETTNDGFDAPLASIDEGGNSIPFQTTIIDQYYPNRELRVNDYLDYINQVPSEFKTGNLKVLNKSNVVKSVEGVFLALRVGDSFTVKDVAFNEYNETLGEWEIVYRDDDYILIEVLDAFTGRIHRVFDGISGQYEYDLVRSITYAVDVNLADVNRILVLNGEISHSYSIPDNVLKHFPGYGDTGMNFSLSFADPDPDPYPRNPDNSDIPNPDVTYYSIPTFDIDGKTYRTNRTLGVTGLVKTSQIIDAEGNSFGYTGYASGFTGPSGAMDLGISGPVGDANPRIIDGSDVYQIPSGDTGIFASYSEAEYRVQWRNWDQDMMIINMSAGDTGVIVEPPFNLIDDIGEGIKRSYWRVSASGIVEYYFSGTLIETSEEVSGSVLAASHTQGMVLLTQEQVDLLTDGADPADFNLTDTNYQLNKRIVREILHDNSVKITEIKEFVPLP